jgi:hypothetical protein
MATSASLQTTVAQWRDAADDLLKVAQAAAPLPEDDDMSGLSLDNGSTSEVPVLPVGDELDRRVDVLLEASDAAIEQVSAESNEGPNAASVLGGLPALLGALEVANTLLQASQDPDVAFDSLGLDEDGALSLAGPRAALDEFKEAMLGHSVTGKVALPDELLGKMETLETTGASELMKLGGEVVLQQAIGELASGTVNMMGVKVKEAFEWAKAQVRLLRKAAVRILEWVLNKFRNMIPERYRGQYDDKVKDIAEKIKDGAVDAVGNLVGFLAGRREAEHAWQERLDDGKTDLAAAQAALPDVIAGHLKRIGYVSTGRKAVSGAVGVVRKIAKLTGPQADMIVAAVVAALMGFVWFQLVDGYNDIEGLPDEAATTG